MLVRLVPHIGHGWKRCLEVVPETKTDSGDALWIGIFSLKRIGSVVDDIGDTDVEDAVARQGRTDSDEVTANSVTRDPQQALGQRALTVRPRNILHRRDELSTCARYLDFQLAEASHQRPRPVAVAVTADANRALAIAAQWLHAASVAGPRQSRFQLALEHALDEFANPIAQASLDRIKPVVEKLSRSLGLRLRKLRLHGIACHGVVSNPALQRRMIRG
jgi:hypothetical protein